jgi:hypothetical protein
MWFRGFVTLNFTSSSEALCEGGQVSKIDKAKEEQSSFAKATEDTVKFFDILVTKVSKI